MPQTGDTPRLLQIVRATKCEKLSEADYTRGLDPATAQKVHATPGMASTSFYQSVIHAV
jgi:hypothetical protein